MPATSTTPIIPKIKTRNLYSWYGTSRLVLRSTSFHTYQFCDSPACLVSQLFNSFLNARGQPDTLIVLPNALKNQAAAKDLLQMAISDDQRG